MSLRWIFFVVVWNDAVLIDSAVFRDKQVVQGWTVHVGCHFSAESRQCGHTGDTLDTDPVTSLRLKEKGIKARS